MVASMESKETYYMLHISYTNSEISISLSYIRPYFVWWFQLYHCATLVLDLPTSILVLATVTLFTFHKSCRSCGSSLVSFEVFPQQNLVDRADNCYRSLYFLFLLFFYVYSIWNFKIFCYQFVVFFPVFLSALYIFHPTLAFSSFYSLFCFLPLFIHFIVWSPLLFPFQICYSFFSLFLLICSVCFSLLLYYYSICSLSISLHLFRSLYLILLCYLFCSCFCFLYTSSFW